MRAFGRLAMVQEESDTTDTVEETEEETEPPTRATTGVAAI